LDFTDHLQKFEYTFGVMYCYDYYVVGKLNYGINVDNEIATRMLTDINRHFGKNKIVFISNREFGHQVDPKVYKLVNAKTMIGIAIVGTTQEQKIQAATEQSLYGGSFGYFNNLESAVEWAKSFTLDSNLLSTS
jgi:hypothetical protein